MMGSSELLVLPTGSANTASVMAGLARAGGRPHMAASPRQVGRTRAVVVPGVGAYDAALDHLRSTGLLAPLSSRIKTGQPTLLICVGLQILCAGSEESPGAAGLGLLPGRALRFSPQVRNPHMGWNHVLPGPSCRLLREGYAYFAHSYRLLPPLPGWETAVACHDGPFVAACERGSILACQFHPELSGSWGERLLRDWLELALSSQARGSGGPEAPC